MANKRYVCAQACQLGGKRYEVGEPLADGVEPNSHFKDTKTGEMVKAKQPEPAEILATENQSVLEKACAETRKPDVSAKSKGGNKGKEPEVKDKEPEAKEEPDGNEDIVSDNNEQSGNSPAPDSSSGN